MTTVRLPWPPRECHPNSRARWAKKAKAVKAYREACAWEMRAQTTPGFREALIQCERICLWLKFFPPDRRHRDDDNILASFKAGRDGLADALGIDDRRFQSLPFIADERRKYGQVEVRFSEGPHAQQAE